MTDAAVADAPAPHPDIETAFVDRQAVLLNVETGAVYALNPSASTIWLLLDGTSDAAAVADELGGLVGRDGAALLPDVNAAIDAFDLEGLLEAPAGPPAASPTPLYPPGDP